MIFGFSTWDEMELLLSWKETGQLCPVIAKSHREEFIKIVHGVNKSILQ
jgi:hypothetical protein